MGNRYIMKLQAPATLECSIDICSLAVDPPSSPLNLNDAHCMEVMPTTWKWEGRVPFQPSPYTPRMLMFASSDMDLD